LSEDLTRLGLSTRGETINELQEMAEVRNIPIEMEDADISYIAQLKKNNPNLDGTILADCSDFISIKSYMRKLIILGKGQNLYTGEIGVPQKVGRKTSVHLLLIVCLPRKDLGWEA